MAVTLKTKTKAKSETAVAVDRLVELKKMIDAVAPLSKEYDKIVKELRAKAAEAKANEQVVFTGTDHSVIFSEAGKVRTIVDMPGIKKAMGNEVFWEVAKVTLTDIDKYLGPEETDGLIIETQDGPRRLTIKEN